MHGHQDFTAVTIVRPPKRQETWSRSTGQGSTAYVFPEVRLERTRGARSLTIGVVLRFNSKDLEERVRIPKHEPTFDPRADTIAMNLFMEYQEEILLGAGMGMNPVDLRVPRDRLFRTGVVETLIYVGEKVSLSTGESNRRARFRRPYTDRSIPLSD
jgi:hypothetical protein